MIKERLYDLILKAHKGYILEGSLSSLVKVKSGNIKKDELGVAKKHFTVTELCSPMDHFLKRKYPEIKPSIELQKRLDYGNKIHKLAENWLSRMNHIVYSEYPLDGIYQGLTITARVDAKINDNLVELKTKSTLPIGTDDAIQKYPQDFEQLVMYSVLDMEHPKENYIIFLSQEDPSKMKSFKIIINDSEKALEFVKKRKSEYTEVVFGGGDPKKLGKCRYCYNPELCQIYNNEDCDYSGLEKKECEIMDFVKIEESEVYAKELSEIIGGWNGKTNLYSLYNLMCPKKCALQNYLERKEDYKFNLTDSLNRNFISNLVFDINKDFILKNKEQKPSHNYQEIYSYKSKLFNKISSINNSGEYLPYITHSVPSDKENNLEKPSPWKIVELGILAALFKKNKGLIFQYYPSLEDKFRVFEVKYKFDKIVYDKIDEMISILNDADLSKIKNLDKCEDWLCEDCPVYNECHAPA